MQKTKTTAVDVKELVSVNCDRCRKSFSADDTFEIQEFHHIEFTGGYGSVFGDGATVRCDICQHCLLVMIQKYMTTLRQYDTVTM